MSTLDPFGYGTHEVLNQVPAMVELRRLFP